MHALAKQRGGQCLSTKYINSRTKLTWKCDKGHKWETTQNIIKNGSWCPICSGNVCLTIKEMHALARERGGKCFSTKYVNKHTKLEWGCAEGHRWQARSGDVKRGSWCPACSMS